MLYFTLILAYMHNSLPYKCRYFWGLIFVGKQHPLKLNPQKFVYTRKWQQ